MQRKTGKLYSAEFKAKIGKRDASRRKVGGATGRRVRLMSIAARYWLIATFEPVGELYSAYPQGLANYEAYMASWRGKPPDSDLSGRALELALTEIERGLC